MRAFLAITLPDDVRESLASLSKRLRKSGAKASWVKPANFHLTLRFLGDVDDQSLEGLRDVLRAQYSGCGPLRMSVEGVGVFPNIRRPGVVWAGMAALEGDLPLVQRYAEDAARAIGLPPEKKAFHPHVTLARVRDHRRLGTLRDALEQARDYVGGEVAAGHVSLFSSELRRDGAVYRVIEEFPLE